MKKIIWFATLYFAIFLTLITFTPVIIPFGRYEPPFLGMPYTIWTGLLLMILMLLNMIVAAIFHPGNDKSE